MRRAIAVVLGAALLWSPCFAGEPPVPDSPKARDSYSLGYEFGGSLRWQEVEVDPDILVGAIRDGLAGKKPAMADNAMRDSLAQVRKKVAVVQDQRARRFAEGNLAKAKAFLEANKAKEGVKALPSGLQYLVLREGSGPSPKPDDAVTVRYRGTLIDGTEFENSAARGDSVPLLVNGVSPGLKEALLLMRPGSKWRIFMPPELAYGERRFGRVPPNSAVTFDLELLSIGGALPRPAAAPGAAGPGAAPGE